MVVAIISISIRLLDIKAVNKCLVIMNFKFYFLVGLGKNIWKQSHIVVGKVQIFGDKRTLV